MGKGDKVLNRDFAVAVKASAKRVRLCERHPGNPGFANVHVKGSLLSHVTVA